MTVNSDDESEAQELGNLLAPSEMLLYRQINPAKMKSNGPGILNFVPGKSNFVPEDGRMLSTRREAITAVGAHNAYIAEGGMSIGTWGVTVQEAHDSELPSYDDEHLPENPPFHVTILFPDNLTRGQQERYAKALHGKARVRGDNGWLHGPVEG